MWKRPFIGDRGSTVGMKQLRSAESSLNRREVITLERIRGYVNSGFSIVVL
jgi:hypothetical protein